MVVKPSTRVAQQQQCHGCKEQSWVLEKTATDLSNFHILLQTRLKPVSFVKFCKELTEKSMIPRLLHPRVLLHPSRDCTQVPMVVLVSDGSVIRTPVRNKQSPRSISLLKGQLILKMIIFQLKLGGFKIRTVGTLVNTETMPKQPIAIHVLYMWQAVHFLDCGTRLTETIDPGWRLQHLVRPWWVQYYGGYLCFLVILQ